MIRFFGVGRSTVLQGTALRVLAIFEDSGREKVTGEDIKPVLNLTGAQSKHQIPMAYQMTLTSETGLQTMSFTAEIDTVQLATGVYELHLVMREDQARLDELVWILSETQYAEMIKEEADPFANSLLLESAPDVHRATRLVEAAFRAKLTGFLRWGDRLIERPGVEISVIEMPRFSLGLLAYLAEVFADNSRHLLLWGAAQSSINISFEERSYRFALQFVSDEFTEMKEAGQMRDWDIVTKILAIERSDFELSAAFRVLSGGASLTVEMRRLQYAVA